MSEYKDPIKMLEMEMNTRVDAYKIAYDEEKAKNKALEERVAELECEVDRLGEMGNVCTYSTTKKVCSTCKCPRLNKTKEGDKS